MKKFLNDISKTRMLLRFEKRRKKFWQENSSRFEKNVGDVIREMKLPKKWRVFVALGKFISDRTILPFDNDAWSATVLMAATKRQGFEALMFLNRSSSEFLSRAALIPLIAHESHHVRQIAASPRNYLRGYFDDRYARNDEHAAEIAIRALPSEFAGELALERILYCYDAGGWALAENMARDLFEAQPELYSGGYDRGMTRPQFELFLRAKRSKNIRMLIDAF